MMNLNLQAKQASKMLIIFGYYIISNLTPGQFFTLAATCDIYVMCKVQIRTICRLACANRGSTLCATIRRSLVPFVDCTTGEVRRARIGDNEWIVTKTDKCAERG